MDPTVIVALIFAASALVGPILLAQLNARQLRMSKEQDYERQDAVAAKVEESSRAAKASAALIVEANDRIALATQTANRKLDVIHTLVNSQMTAAIQSELDATTRELAMMREVISLNSVAGRSPSESSMVAITATQEKIRELQATVSERHRQDALASEQALTNKPPA